MMRGPRKINRDAARFPHKNKMAAICWWCRRNLERGEHACNCPIAQRREAGFEKGEGLTR